MNPNIRNTRSGIPILMPTSTHAILAQTYRQLIAVNHAALGLNPTADASLHNTNQILTQALAMCTQRLGTPTEIDAYTSAHLATISSAAAANNDTAPVPPASPALDFPRLRAELHDLSRCFKQQWSDYSRTAAYRDVLSIIEGGLSKSRIPQGAGAEQIWGIVAERVGVVLEEMRGSALLAASEKKEKEQKKRAERTPGASPAFKRVKSDEEGTGWGFGGVRGKECMDGERAGLYRDAVDRTLREVGRYIGGEEYHRLFDAYRRHVDEELGDGRGEGRGGVEMETPTRAGKKK
ncbi:hypothetical protein EJ04DRAFT_522249 [Polyplosphaeria fusca]|uniref:Uncharacterized protein n=1 Tax=Polyplosphaeria fusca TaxID=682080 RepID=A0A9P4R3J3_9PLEO|nr:hypothetical protein EJ04DRAFT_522249 [Polyplosphaeria fusca]